VLHGDFIFLKQTSVGGNNVIFFTVDEFSGFCKGVAGKSKAAAPACAMATVAEFNAFQHQVRRMHTDSEAVLKAMKKPLGMIGVHLEAYPPGLFEKRAERSIQTVKARKRTVLASLPYELPPELECELYLSIIAAMNDVPNSTSAPLSPTQLVTHRKPTPRPYSFGQTGLYYVNTNKEMRSAWAIYLGSNTRGNGHRLFVPQPPGTGRVVVAMKFQPMDQWPEHWHLKPRTRLVSASSEANLYVQSGLPLPSHPIDLSQQDDDPPISTGSAPLWAAPADPGSHQEGVSSELAEPPQFEPSQLSEQVKSEPEHLKSEPVDAGSPVSAAHDSPSAEQPLPMDNASAQPPCIAYVDA
jgi:hypothetical protein